MKLVYIIVACLSVLTLVTGRLNDPCETNHDCNDPAVTSSIPYSYCRKSVATARGECVCHPWFTALSSGTCRRGVIGSPCSISDGGDDFCLNGIGTGAICDPSERRCRCARDQEELRDNCGATYCHPIGEGSSCTPGTDGNSVCQRALQDSAATCHQTTKVCVCASGKLYSLQRESCVLMAPAPLRETICRACIETGGKCIEAVPGFPNTPGFPYECDCPKCKRTAVSSDWMEVGCNQLYAHPGEMCSAARNIICLDPHSTCDPHAGVLEDVSRCVCCPGYVEVCHTNGEPRMKKCVKEVSRKVDRNCEQCWARGGRCYQDSPLEGDLDVGIGCRCPVHLSTSDPMDPRTFCDTEHVNVTCTAESMKVCYDPNKHVQYPGVTKELMDQKARLYVEHHQGDVSCQFQYDSTLRKWCLELNLHEHHVNMQSGCGIQVSHSSRTTISYSAIIVLQRLRHKITINDFCVCVYCVFDTVVEVYNGLIVGKAVRHSGGHVISPELRMFVQGEHGKVGYTESVSIGENIRVCIEMTDDKNVYEAILPQFCIASNSPSLVNKRDTRSCLLVKGACVTENNYLAELDNFRPLPTDRRHVCTGFFPAFHFVETGAVYFHCAVKTCRDSISCKAANCTCKTDEMVRTKREAGLEGPYHSGLSDSMTSQIHTLESDYHVIRWKRAVDADHMHEAQMAFQDPDLDHQMVGLRILPEEYDIDHNVESAALDDVIIDDDVRVEKDRRLFFGDDAIAEDEELRTDEAAISETLVIVLCVLLTAIVSLSISGCVYYKFRVAT